MTCLIGVWNTTIGFGVGDFLSLCSSVFSVVDLIRLVQLVRHAFDSVFQP
jgi:hypothetical protein